MMIRFLALAAVLALAPAQAAQTLSLTLSAVEPGRDVRVNVWLPEGAAGALPVIVFSHGNYCEETRYGVLFDSIAAAGYAILAPAHLDRAPPPTSAAERLTGARTWSTRLADMRGVADRLAEIERQLPGGVTLERTGLIAAGHSYGGAVAQALGGARMAARDGTGTLTQARDPRFTAVLAWSPPGPIRDFLDETSAATLAVPMLLVTGTKDFSTMWPDWRLHAATFEGAPPGGKTLMVVEGLDHYLGGLACLPKDTPPQAEEAKSVAAAMIAFLDAQTRTDAAAAAAIMACAAPPPWPKTTLTCK